MIWKDYAQYKDLRAVIDPADSKGFKNTYINILHHKLLMNEIGYLLKNKKVLDIGCGIGRFTKFLQSRGAEVTGVDICQEMIDQNTECKTICTSLDKLPFDDNSFDIIFSVWTLQYMNELELSVISKEISRVLKPGGFVFIIEQMSDSGYGNVVSRHCLDYGIIFNNNGICWGKTRTIAYENDLIIGIIRHGIIPEELFMPIADLHLGLNKQLPFKYGIYLDTFMLFRKVE